LGQYDEAIELYDKVIGIDPNYTGAINNKGIVLSDLGRYDEAIELYDKVIGIDPNYTGAINNKGTALSDLGRYDEAIKLYDRAIGIDPNYTYAIANKGNALSNLSKYDEAIEMYDKALSLDPEDVEIIFNKAFVLGVDLKSYEEALRLTQENLEKYPKHKGLLCLTAEIYRETGIEGYASHYEERLFKEDQDYECKLIQKVSIEQSTFL
jgi:tetratricopeptide (TPR) repeat protein